MSTKPRPNAGEDLESKHPSTRRPTLRDVAGRWTERTAATSSSKAEESLARARELRSRMSLPEVLLWQRLRRGGIDGLKFRRQHVLGSFIADFYCHELKLVVEVDGSSHEARVDGDSARDAWMKGAGLRVVRITARDVLSDPDEVAGRIGRIAQTIRERRE